MSDYIIANSPSLLNSTAEEFEDEYKEMPKGGGPWP